jgi:very-short-patch-repair endonuclease
VSKEYNDNLHKGAIGKLYQYGSELRQKPTKAEEILWEYLRNRKMDGLKFRRQHPVDKFIADFYCHEKKLIIELDGAVHDDTMNAKYDEARTYQLSGSGIRVVRFRNSEIENNIEGVLNTVREATKN